MSRLTRFLHLERPRPARGAEDGPPGAAPAPPAGSGAALGRFGAEPASLELHRPGEGERPFTRCMRCGMDHHRSVTECTGCGAPLDTDAQREANERLWAGRREEAAREGAAAAEREAARAREAAGLDEARRAMAEELAREVGERERRRLDLELGRTRWPACLLDLLLAPRRRRWW